MDANARTDRIECVQTVVHGMAWRYVLYALQNSNNLWILQVVEVSIITQVTPF